MVVCEQHRDGVPDPDVTVCPPKGREKDRGTLKRKLASAKRYGWSVEVAKDGFHAWKEYTDGDGTPERPYRKDRYFRIES